MLHSQIPETYADTQLRPVQRYVLTKRSRVFPRAGQRKPRQVGAARVVPA